MFYLFLFLGIWFLCGVSNIIFSYYQDPDSDITLDQFLCLFFGGSLFTLGIIFYVISENSHTIIIRSRNSRNKNDVK